ncbi:PspC domain-containing protein [Pseudoalteromonas sp. McH1-7]|uniref:PspC domain-containing protein n=1 Tax=Pseudoalteromonas TaxID=53246 RepID=UPI000F650C41|nr:MULTISPECIES: PspC domain-containing protein [Pseudoalteromonas]MDW7550435.1 PspC domain-containing protein [Pseudoalteromonas peptidolytica]NUZ11849.1 PspC domain-containing protein [Pseudoalteromonas sp. McH1-7]RRS09888.1 PspC domain-containing protein [Pseudoalteromonas sp. J010]USD28233.1 PspC domain-containing protein [Pseudoalteromonas sp. SCSIO 43201]
MKNRYQSTLSQMNSSKKIGGVCAQLAQRFDMPIWLTRLLTVLLFFKFPMFVMLAYGVAWFAMPKAKYDN